MCGEHDRRRNCTEWHFRHDGQLVRSLRRVTARTCYTARESHGRQHAGNPVGGLQENACSADSPSELNYEPVVGVMGQKPCTRSLLSRNEDAAQAASQPSETVTSVASVGLSGRSKAIAGRLICKGHICRHRSC